MSEKKSTLYNVYLTQAEIVQMLGAIDIAIRINLKYGFSTKNLESLDDKLITILNFIRTNK